MGRVQIMERFVCPVKEVELYHKGPVVSDLWYQSWEVLCDLEHRILIRFELLKRTLEKEYTRKK